jgi:hypothetical protein
MPVERRQRHQRDAGGDASAKGQRQSNDGDDARTMLAVTRVQRGRWHQCNNGGDTTTATAPAKQWRRRQRNEGDNASGTPAKMPARWWRRHGCDEDNKASAATATTRRQQQRQRINGLSPSAVLSLFYLASIAFAAPVDGWLLHSLPTQQHTNHITKLKTFPVSTSWTYFELLKVSTCLV